MRGSCDWKRTRTNNAICVHCAKLCLGFWQRKPCTLSLVRQAVHRQLAPSHGPTLTMSHWLVAGLGILVELCKMTRATMHDNPTCTKHRQAVGIRYDLNVLTKNEILGHLGLVKQSECLGLACKVVAVYL